MFALIVGEVIYLKTAADETQAFEREGSEPFSYTTKDGRRTIMSYWRLPDRLYDDPEALADWSRAALAAARQQPAKRKRAARRPAGRQR